MQPSFQRADGVLAVALEGSAVAGSVPTALRVRIGDADFTVPVRASGRDFESVAELRVAGAIPWWPHNMGEPRLYSVTLQLECGSEVIELGATRVGFRSIERAAGDGFALRVNARDVFCRGACWMPVDPVGLRDDPAEIRHALGLMRRAGLNMVRISGTTFYESDAFYDACDELGMLVWQDFMFARMDYPIDDAEFAREVEPEIEQALASLHYRPSLAVLCGNSEVEQQAAMVGLAADAGRTRLVHGGAGGSERRVVSAHALRDVLADRRCTPVPRRFRCRALLRRRRLPTTVVGRARFGSALRR